MVDTTNQATKTNRTWVQWVVGIPVSLLVLVMFLVFVQPWGEPRESITSTAPKDGDFYDPSSEQASFDLPDRVPQNENSGPEGVQPSNGRPQIIDVNLASWKPVAELSVPADQLPDFATDIEGRVLVEISAALWSKGVGELVQFSIPQLEDVLVGTVTKIDTNRAHTRKLEGTIQDGSQEFAFELTLGETATYAQINTATGNYQMIGTQHYGWLMDRANIAPGVDFSLPDHFVEDPDPLDREPEPDSSSNSVE